MLGFADILAFRYGVAGVESSNLSIPTKYTLKTNSLRVVGFFRLGQGKPEVQPRCGLAIICDK